MNILKFLKINCIAISGLMIPYSQLDNPYPELESIIQEVAKSDENMQIASIVKFKKLYLKISIQEGYITGDKFDLPFLSWHYLNQHCIIQSKTKNGDSILLSPAKNALQFTPFYVNYAKKDEELERCIREIVDIQALYNQETYANEFQIRIIDIILENNFERPEADFSEALFHYAESYYQYEFVTKIGYSYFEFTPTVPFLINFTPFRIYSKHDRPPFK